MDEAHPDSEIFVLGVLRITCSHMSLAKACHTASPELDRVGCVALQGRAWHTGHSPS